MTPKKLSELFAGQCLLLHEARGGRQLLCTECCEGALRAAQIEAIERCVEVADNYYRDLGTSARDQIKGNAVVDISAKLRALKEKG